VLCNLWHNTGSTQYHKRGPDNHPAIIYQSLLRLNQGRWGVSIVFTCPCHLCE
jgi:hypothetical protein